MIRLFLLVSFYKVRMSLDSSCCCHSTKPEWFCWCYSTMSEWFCGVYSAKLELFVQLHCTLSHSEAPDWIWYDSQQSICLYFWHDLTVLVGVILKSQNEFGLVLFVLFDKVRMSLPVLFHKVRMILWVLFDKVGIVLFVKLHCIESHWETPDWIWYNSQQSICLYCPDYWTVLVGLILQSQNEFGLFLLVSFYKVRMSLLMLFYKFRMILWLLFRKVGLVCPASLHFVWPRSSWIDLVQ